MFSAANAKGFAAASSHACGRTFSIPAAGAVNGEPTLQVASDPRRDLPFGDLYGNDVREGRQRVRLGPDDCVPKSGVGELGWNYQRLGDAVKMKVYQP